MTAGTPTRPRRGFTLLETVLATVIGGMVLAGSMSMFLAISRTEKTMARASRHMEELALTQQVFRRSFMTMVLAPTASVQDAVEEAEQDGEVTEAEMALFPRPRVLLEFDIAPSITAMQRAALLDGVRVRDPAGYGFGPQRLEIVLPDKPVPESMRLAPAAWSTGAGDDLIEAYDPSGVEIPDSETGLRGVFELRPDGARERVMEGYGIVPSTGLEPTPLTPAARAKADGWTLWWRPIYGEEYAARQAGQAYDVDLMPAMLAEAVPLVRGIEVMRWTAFAAEDDPNDPDAPVITERWPEYAGTTVEDIPGYLELELKTTSGSYANWMFEMGWSLAEESSEDVPAEDEETPEEDGQPEQTTPQGLDALNALDGAQS